MNVRAFQVWKVIKLGTHKDAASLKAAIEAKGIEVSDWSFDVMRRPAFTLASQEATVDLAIVSVGEFGFTKATPLRDIHARAIELGLQLCPAEVGPQLRLQFPDQPRDGYLRVAMEAITDSRGRPVLFYLGHADGRWLEADWGRPDSTWSLDCRFVFVLQ